MRSIVWTLATLALLLAPTQGEAQSQAVKCPVDATWAVGQYMPQLDQTKLVAYAPILDWKRGYAREAADTINGTTYRFRIEVLPAQEQFVVVVDTLAAGAARSYWINVQRLNLERHSPFDCVWDLHFEDGRVVLFGPINDEIERAVALECPECRAVKQEENEWR